MAEGTGSGLAGGGCLWQRAFETMTSGLTGSRGRWEATKGFEEEKKQDPICLLERSLWLQRGEQTRQGRAGGQQKLWEEQGHGTGAGPRRGKVGVKDGAPSSALYCWVAAVGGR